jgi:hypothetical protein
MGNKSPTNMLSCLRVRPEVHRRAKSLAARAGVPLADFAGRIIEPALDRAEKELTRLEGDRPSHGRPLS